MSIFGWIILGLIAGTIAKKVLPGKMTGGWIATSCLGIVGALVGGFLGSRFFNVNIQGFFSIWTWLLAIGGSMLALVIWGFLTKKRA